MSIRPTRSNMRCIIPADRIFRSTAKGRLRAPFSFWGEDGWGKMGFGDRTATIRRRVVAGLLRSRLCFRPFAECGLSPSPAFLKPGLSLSPVYHRARSFVLLPHHLAPSSSGFISRPDLSAFGSLAVRPSLRSARSAFSLVFHPAQGSLRAVRPIFLPALWQAVSPGNPSLANPSFAASGPLAVPAHMLRGPLGAAQPRRSPAAVPLTAGPADPI